MIWQLILEANRSMFEVTLSLAQAFVKRVFFKHHSVHLLNVRDSLSASRFSHLGIRAIVSHICCSIHQSHISFVSLFSLGEWLVPIWVMVDSVVVLSTMTLMCLP